MSLASDPNPTQSDSPAPLSRPPRIGHPALVVLTVLAIFYTLYFARAVLLPIALALLLAIVLRPAVRALTHLRLPEPLAAAVVVALLLGLTVLLAAQVSTTATAWVARWPTLSQEVGDKIEELSRPLEQARELSAQLEAVTNGGEEDAPDQVVIEGPGMMEQIFSQAQTVVVSFLGIIILLLFLLARGSHTIAHIAQAFSYGGGRATFLDVYTVIEREIGRYVGTIALINAALGLLTGLMLSLIGFPNPVFWGLFTAIANFIPYIGPLLTIMGLMITGLLAYDAWSEILLPPAAFLVLTSLEGNLITPYLVGQRLVMNPILVFLSVVVWSWLWGIPGAVLAVPLLAVFKIVCDHVDRLAAWRPILR